MGCRDALLWLRTYHKVQWRQLQELIVLLTMSRSKCRACKSDAGGVGLEVPVASACINHTVYFAASMSAGGYCT